MKDQTKEELNYFKNKYESNDYDIYLVTITDNFNETHELIKIKGLYSDVLDYIFTLDEFINSKIKDIKKTVEKKGVFEIDFEKNQNIQKLLKKYNYLKEEILKTKKQLQVLGVFKQ